MSFHKTISITGGTGFIGSRLIEILSQVGNYKIRILTRNKNFKISKIKIFYADLTDHQNESIIKDFVSGADVLIHLASELHDETKMNNLHIEGTKKLLKLCDGKVKKWINLSSTGVYGEKPSGLVDQFTIENPNNLYEKTKLMSDQLLINSNIHSTIIRPSIVFGKKMKTESFFQMFQMIKKKHFFYLNKNAILNFVHIDDLIAAIIKLINTDVPNHRKYILSQHINIKELAKAISNGMGIEEPKITLPEKPIRLLVRILENFSKFPLTTKRINVLTNECIYDSSLIQNEINFKYQSNLQELFKNYARSI